MSDTIQVQVFNGGQDKIGPYGYMALRGENVVAFHVDARDVPTGRLYPVATCRQTVDHKTHKSYDFPCVTLDDGEDGEMIDLSFPQFEGWQVHSVFGGKTLSICLAKYD
jgi:hypothetical protein